MLETIYIAEQSGTAIPFHCAASGIDRSGALWIPFNNDRLEWDGECSICDAEIENGYLCMDDANEVCAEHVQIVPPWFRDILARDFEDAIESKNALVHARCEIGVALTEIGARQVRNKYLGWTEPVNRRDLNETLGISS